MCTFKNTTSTFPLPITRHHNGARSNSSCSNRDRGFAEKFSNEETSARSALLCDKRSRDYGRSDYSQSESGRVPAAPFVMRVCLINSHRIYSVTIIREQRGHEYDEHEEKASVAVSWRAPRAHGPTVFNEHLRPHNTRENENTGGTLEGPFVARHFLSTLYRLQNTVVAPNIAHMRREKNIKRIYFYLKVSPRCLQKKPI